MIKFLVLFTLISKFLFAQDYNTVKNADTLTFNPTNKYKLRHYNIIPQSELIQLRGRILYETEYLIDFSTLSFQLADTVTISVFDTIVVNYTSFIITLKPVYRNNDLVRRFDDKLKDSILILKSDGAANLEESIFGKGIERSGSIYRGFTVGTNRDFSLQSGMRLELSGNLTDDIEISAALTDENTPIQPEGTTESLEEIDKVFIQLKHKNFTAIFGDYELEKKIGEFGGIKRKLQGLLAEANYKEHSGYFGFASAKGKFNSQTMTGIDGVQGPYRLNGLNGERDIIVIAGTERVFLDGQEVKRGESNQYVIDYSIAEVSFSPSIIITTATRIIVDFEYADRRYTRNVFLAGAESKILNNFSLAVQYIREGDDQDSPIDISLSSSDKELLSLAGDDRLVAVRTGVTLAVVDSNGVRRGQYTEVDTTINGSLKKLYRYAPEDTTAVYNITFTFVGEGQGEYSRAGIGNFYYSGLGLGSYLPVIFLPLPALNQSGTIVAKYNYSDFLLNIEFSGSLHDRNRLSQVDDQDNSGFARNISLNYSPKRFSLFGGEQESFSVDVRERFVQGRYTSIDRINSVEYERDFNLLGVANADETLREVKAFYKYGNIFSNRGGYSFLSRGDQFSTNRLTNDAILKTELFTLSSNTDLNFSNALIHNSRWLKQKLTGTIKAGFVALQFPLLYEDRTEKSKESDSLYASSFRFIEMNPEVGFNPTDQLFISLNLINRSDYLVKGGLLLKESASIGYGGELTYTSGREFSSNTSVNFRKKEFTDEFRSFIKTNSNVLLVKSVSRFRVLDNNIEGELFYEGTTRKTTKPERVFLQVDAGRGNYRYRGDLNENGIKDESEFELTSFDGDFILLTVPSDELYPVITLTFLPRIKINSFNLFNMKNNIGEIFKEISSETTWRIEENSTLNEYAKIYLLNFSYFRNPTTTIRGVNFFQQDILIFENSNDLSFRGRYNQRESLNQFSGGTETGFGKEINLQAKLRLIKEMSNLTEVSSVHDNLNSVTAQNRNRKIKTELFQTDFSYRPIRNLEAGLKVKVSRSEDLYPETPTMLDLNSQSVRIVYSLTGSGRLRLELERIELLTQQTQNYLPYELTGGNSTGKNYYVRLNFDYRISLNLQTTTYYEGRSLGGGRLINLAKSEIRAFF